MYYLNNIFYIRILVFGILYFILSGYTYASTSKVPSKNDTCTLIQLTVNLKSLQQYFHIDKYPDRKPLKLVLNNIRVNCSTLVKFEHPIKIIDKSNANISKTPFFEISNIIFSNNNVKIFFEYNIEGIKGSVKYRFNNNTWSYYDLSIIEM